MLNYQFLIEANALSSTNVETTLRFCCQPGFSDVGGRVWTPCIIDPGLFQVNLFSGSKTYGESKYSYGEVVLNNMVAIGEDGPLDLLSAYTFGGREITMYVGPLNATFPGGFTKVYTAVVEHISINWNDISFTLRGRQAELAKPFDTFVANKFLGNNQPATPPATGLIGFEGVETDLKDKPKPVLIGRAFNVSPVLCNTSKLIYAVSPLSGFAADEFKSMVEVYDSGVKLKYEDVSTDLHADNPMAGAYLVDKAGYFRLGSTPVGLVTCTGVQRGYGLKSTPSELIKYILTTAGFTDMIDEANFDAYALLDSYERGIYLNSNTNLSTIIDSIMSPLGYWYFNISGQMQLGLLQEPSTLTPVFTAVADVNITKFSRSKSVSTKGGIPASSVSINYGKNYTKQTTVAGLVNNVRRAWLAEEWRTVTQARVGIANPLAEELKLDTALTEAAFLSEVASLYSVDREIINIEIINTEFLTASAILPGQCVAVDLNGRFDYNGKHMIVIGITTNYVEESVNLVLWG